MNSHEKLIQRTMDLQREITREGLTRRDLLKMGMLSLSSGLLLPIPGLSLRAARADAICPEPGKDLFSPPTRPWTVELPRLVEKQVVPGNDPSSCDVGYGGALPGPGVPVGTMTGGDSKFRCCEEFPELHNATPYAELDHQAWGKGGRLGNFAPQKFYEMRAKQFNHVWHPDLPAGNSGQPAWGFDSVVPGPMFRTRYGEPHFVRIHNDLPAQNLGFGINQISTHMHNLHSPSESDGNPLFVNYSGHYYDYHYPNVYAGVNQYGGIGNPNEALGTLWYHDHKLDFTSQNVYAGLAGMNCIYDAHGIYADPNMGDYGDETKGWRLPCGDNYEFDVGLVFHDRQFDPNGVDFFPLTCLDGAIGDKMTVNGKIQPFMPVKRRKYRFRMLNMGPSRSYDWFLSNGASFVVIANDGNLLPAPVVVKNFKQTVAERFDVIMDFSLYPAGTQIVLVNRAEQKSGRGPTGNLISPGFQVLKFVVTSDAFGVDESRIPAKLRPLPDIKQPISRSRSWEFKRNGGEWTVNGLPYNRNVISAEIPEGSAERWTIINGGGSWQHPVHIHYEEHRMLTYNRRTLPPIEGGRKDVIRLDANATAEIYMRFRDFKGIYPMHCHNVVHEDHAMMVMWKIV
ncbi:MAG: bilirubin oxidase [Proteobacteria bacterium]|nr:bilirubin oxidase [Pseudomonadota bacterium]